MCQQDYWFSEYHVWTEDRAERGVYLPNLDLKHFMASSKPRTGIQFKCGNSAIQHKYLSVFLTENMGYTLMSKMLAQSASRNLRLLI